MKILGIKSIFRVVIAAIVVIPIPLFLKMVKPEDIKYYFGLVTIIYIGYFLLQQILKIDNDCLRIIYINPFNKNIKLSISDIKCVVIIQKVGWGRFTAGKIIINPHDLDLGIDDLILPKNADINIDTLLLKSEMRSLADELRRRGIQVYTIGVFPKDFPGY